MELDPERYDKPRSAELTILFADIRGFTGISESLSPEALRDYIDEYLTAMSAVIRERHGGTLDKYIGDAIMAFWGAPIDDADHARHAVRAALAIGIGVNSGMLRVGDMGSRAPCLHGLGDAVNVASRLEGRTKTYGVGILVERLRAAGSKMWYSGRSTASGSRARRRPLPSMSLWKKRARSSSRGGRHCALTARGNGTPPRPFSNGCSEPIRRAGSMGCT